MAKWIKRILGVVAVVFGFIFVQETWMVRNYQDPQGFFYAVRGVRLVLDGPREPSDRSNKDVLGVYEQIQIRFLGFIPVNCLVSQEFQPEDRCAIYRWRPAIESNFSLWKKGTIRAYWRWDGKQWVSPHISPWLVEAWEKAHRT